MSLSKVFSAIGTAVKEGHNTATFAVTPMPKAGEVLQGLLQVGGVAVPFSVAVPL